MVACPVWAHTFGRRLRAANVPLETRKVLLGHRNGDITTHYSVSELEKLLMAVNKVCEEKSGKSPATLTGSARPVIIFGQSCRATSQTCLVKRDSGGFPKHYILHGYQWIDIRVAERGGYCSMRHHPRSRWEPGVSWVGWFQSSRPGQWLHRPSRSLSSCVSPDPTSRRVCSGSGARCR